MPDRAGILPGERETESLSTLCMTATWGGRYPPPPAGSCGCCPWCKSVQQSPPPSLPQVRIHSTTDTDFYLRARSKPIIEHSCRVRFAPFTLLDPGIHPEGTATEAAPSVAAPAAAATATVAATAAAGEAPLLQGTDPADAACREAQLQVLLRRHKLGEETGMYQQVGEYTRGKFPVGRNAIASKPLLDPASVNQYHLLLVTSGYPRRDATCNQYPACYTYCRWRTLGGSRRHTRPTGRCCLRATAWPPLGSRGAHWQRPRRRQETGDGRRGPPLMGRRKRTRYDWERLET